MSIKHFASLGEIQFPFTVEEKVSVSANSDGTTTVVDHALVPFLGTAGIPANLPTLFPTAADVGLPNALSSNPNQIGPGAPTYSTIKQNKAPQLFSQESEDAFFDTFYHDFNFDCYPVYNFWTEDEETNVYGVDSSMALADIPRYVRLVWNMAPDLSFLHDLTPDSVRRNENMKPAPLGGDEPVPISFTNKGINFAPSHLNDFSIMKNSLANGFIAPGVVRAVVELAQESLDPVPDRVSVVDEDTFLTHPDFVGVSIEDLKSNFNTSTNGVLAAGKVSNDPLSAGSQQTNLFSGKFSVEKKGTWGNVSLEIKGAHASSPPLGFTTKVSSADDSNVSIFDRVIDSVDKVKKPFINVDTTERIRVAFINPTIGGALSEERVNNMLKPEHAEATVALGQMLPNTEALASSDVQLKKRSYSVPSFKSPAGLPRLEYVGYVIEKYEQVSGGTFSLVDTIDIPSREYTQYVDTKVRYGGTYRYRIRSIIRWTRPDGVEMTGDTGARISPSQNPLFSLTPSRSTYFASEWSKKWIYGSIIDIVAPQPPDEITVRPDSYLKRIFVSLKVPGNPQFDISGMRLFRKLKDQAGADLTGWIQVGQTWPPKNVLFVDDDVDFFQNNQTQYVYAAQTLTHHGEYSFLSEQISTRLSSEVRVKGEFGVDFISQAGVSLENHGAFATIPMKQTMTEVIVPTGAVIRLSARDGDSNVMKDQSNYVMRVESLVTGEKIDLPLSVSYTNLPTNIRTTSAGREKGTKVPTVANKAEVNRHTQTPSVPRGKMGS